MKAIVAIPTLLACAIIAAFVILVRADHVSTATPTHVAAVFFDGVNHGDYRQTCSVWRAGRKHPAQCEGWLALRQAETGGGYYTVVAHSEKGWREGSTEVASVKVRGAYGTITARLVKTAHGWLVVTVE